MIAGIELLHDPAALPAFAQANGWAYRAVGDPPALAARRWERGSYGAARAVITGDGWQVGHLVGKSRGAVAARAETEEPRLGFFAIRLPRFMPHLILDAVGNDVRGSSSLVRQPKRSQRLSLEGDFDQHFTLYVPKGYERDALYVFTPDLMALLIDETGDLDVEVRDDVVIILKPGSFDLADPATWQRFDRLRAIIGRTFHTRTKRWEDDRVAPLRPDFQPVWSDVAPAGRRLRERLSKSATVGIAVGIGGVLIALAAIGMLPILAAGAAQTG